MEPEKLEIGNKVVTVAGIFDGIGKGGEKMAEICEKTILRELKNQNELTKDAFEKAFEKAETACLDKAKADKKLVGATTATVVVVDDKIIHARRPCPTIHS